MGDRCIVIRTVVSEVCRYSGARYRDDVVHVAASYDGSPETEEDARQLSELMDEPLRPHMDPAMTNAPDYVRVALVKAPWR